MNRIWDGIHRSGHSICSSCIRICHSDHNVKYAKFGKHFCDCGERGKEICQALRGKSLDFESKVIIFFVFCLLDNLTICFYNIQDSPVVYPGATFHWAPVEPFGSVVETIKDGKLKVRFEKSM